MSQYDALVWNEEQIIAFAEIVCSIQREIVDTSQGLATVKQEVQNIVEGKIARASLAEQLRSHAHLLLNEVN